MTRVFIKSTPSGLVDARCEVVFPGQATVWERKPGTKALETDPSSIKQLKRDGQLRLCLEALEREGFVEQK